MPSKPEHWRSLGGFVTLNIVGLCLMFGSMAADLTHGPSIALLISLASSFAALKAGLINSNTHFDAMLTLAGAYIMLTVSPHHLGIAKLLALAWLTLLIVILNRRYRELIIGR